MLSSCFCVYILNLYLTPDVKQYLYAIIIGTPDLIVRLSENLAVKPGMPMIITYALVVFHIPSQI